MIKVQSSSSPVFRRWSAPWWPRQASWADRARPPQVVESGREPWRGVIRARIRLLAASFRASRNARLLCGGEEDCTFVMPWWSTTKFIIMFLCVVFFLLFSFKTKGKSFSLVLINPLTEWMLGEIKALQRDLCMFWIAGNSIAYGRQ